MIRLLNIGLIVAVLVVAMQVYGLEHKSRDAGKQLSALREEIAEERETIRRLRAEWSYLNNPARLETLAGRHLEHKPEEVARVLMTGQIAEAVPVLEKQELEKSEDLISDMLANPSTAIGGTPADVKSQPDLIGQILKGLDQ